MSDTVDLLIASTCSLFSLEHPGSLAMGKVEQSGVMMTFATSVTSSSIGRGPNHVCRVTTFDRDDHVCEAEARCDPPKNSYLRGRWE